MKWADEADDALVQVQGLVMAGCNLQGGEDDDDDDDDDDNDDDDGDDDDDDDDKHLGFRVRVRLATIAKYSHGVMITRVNSVVVSMMNRSQNARTTNPSTTTPVMVLIAMK